MVYAGVLAHGTSMSAAETARMIPSLTAASVRQAMRWAVTSARTPVVRCLTSCSAIRSRPPGVGLTWPPQT